MVKKLTFYLNSFLILLMLGGCASRMKDQQQGLRDFYGAGELDKAKQLLDKSELKKDQKSQLLWLLESGTLALARQELDLAIQQFQAALELIDQLYTKKLSAKAASLLVNDAQDVFYGASYERSYAHYFLAKAYYARYLISGKATDLQGARATILAWDSYFAELQRSASVKTIYQTDLMLKVFGAQIHEVSGIRNDHQIALQLYKDALNILENMGGVFAAFNQKHLDYIRDFESALGKGEKVTHQNYLATSAQDYLKQFLIYKVLSLTRQHRPQDFEGQVKFWKATPELVAKIGKEKNNVVIVLEEGLIPRKVGKPFNFGLKGAIDAVESPAAKAFIATVGAEIVTAFAMNTLGMTPANLNTTGSFIFAHDMTRLAVQEAAISFELPAIETAPAIKDLDLVIKDQAGKIHHQAPLALVSENGGLARVVLEEDAVARYVKTGTRVAVQHLVAIVTAMQIYQKLKPKSEFMAKAAAMTTYVASSKGIGALQKADTRHWTTLPATLRMGELMLPTGEYQVFVVASKGEQNAPEKLLGQIKVNGPGKVIHTFKLITP